MENTQNTQNTQNNEVKKGKKGKIIGIVVAAVVVIAAVLAWYSGAVGGIDQTEAKEIAYAQVPGSETEGTAILTEDFDDMKKTYDVQLTYDNVLYEFEILARNGNIVNQESERIGAVQQPTQPATQGSTQAATQANDIGMEKAREIALQNVAGATADNVTKYSVDNENGRMVYEIEIVYNEMEYDFDIDAATGDIIGQSSESIYN